MVKTAIEVSDGRLPVVAGVAGNNINEVIALAKNARRVGAKYAMIPAPFYDSIDQDGIYEWYRILAESLDIGIMIYDQSWRTDLKTTLGVPLIERLAGLKNIVSLKYGSPSLLEDSIVALERFSDRFAFIDNSLAYTAVLAHMHGGSGFISGPSAWWPEFEVHFFRLMEEGRYKEAERWHARLATYMSWFAGEFFKAPRWFHSAAIIKASLEYVGLYGGPLRPPFRAMSSEEKEQLHAVMAEMGVKRLAHA
jgi:4-hydroxy-tetrahydrodipicolinate synthase